MQINTSYHISTNKQNAKTTKMEIKKKKTKGTYGWKQKKIKPLLTEGEIQSGISKSTLGTYVRHRLSNST